MAPRDQAVRGGTARSEYGETSEALFLTSGYAYDCAGDAAARFAGEQQGMTYSRLQNPTVQMLEERIALMEGPRRAGHGVGMAAMTAALLCQLETAITSSRAARRSGRAAGWSNAAAQIRHLRRLWIDARDPQAFVDATKPKTKVYFLRKTRSTRRWTSSTWLAVCGYRARARDRVGGRQRLRLARAATAAGVRRGCHRLFRDQADGRAGARARGRGMRDRGVHREHASGVHLATPARPCRRSTPG